MLLKKSSWYDESCYSFSVSLNNCSYPYYWPNIALDFFIYILQTSLYTFQLKAPVTMWTSGVCPAWPSSLYVSGWRQTPLPMVLRSVTLFPANIMKLSSSAWGTHIFGLRVKASGTFCWWKRWNESLTDLNSVYLDQWPILLYPRFFIIIFIFLPFWREICNETGIYQDHLRGNVNNWTTIQARFAKTSLNFKIK